MKELPKIYDPKKVESEIYRQWEESGFFNPDNIEGEPYSIMMPPPNVTGVLHLGHAMENSLMDVMARFQRMNGKKVLLLPGTDHAAVATQAKVERILTEQGIKNPREELGREKLLEKIREFSENSKATILSQIKSMGTSCDWSRLAYTFDEKRGLAVNTVFKKMYDDGLIYRGYRVINWSVKGQSTCSDDELVHIERVGKIYTFRYSKDFPIAIATTRPETKLGDSAVAVNPDDARYKEFIGQIFTVEIGAKKPLQIKIIADENVDLKFGTGALGVTPAHSAVDFEMYEKQKALKNPIELIQVINEKGFMTKEAGIEYAGLPVEKAREKFVGWLKENDLLEKEEETVQSVGTSDRFGDVVEALPMTQWFVDVNKKIPSKDKSLKELMQDVVKIGHDGDPEKKIEILPERFEKNYFGWIENLRDWCISRQVWWGHRIPVWYRNDEIYCGLEAPAGNDWEQDPDTLDTWFSSGLWTFSTLGWPENTDDLKRFHPTNWMQMGYEILFFWMARMILMTTYSLNTIPFKNVYIHGILRDEKGQKFSKSLGNTLDPKDMIDKYGCDALRLSLLMGVAPGNDSKFYEDKVESYRNFTNKLWNISRYILQTAGSSSEKFEIKKENCTLADLWIIGKTADTINEVSQDLENYRFSVAGEKLEKYTWNILADWYLEASKFENNKSAKAIILSNILEDLLRLWHPFIPFVTESIWQEAGKKNFLMIEKWPTIEKYNQLLKDTAGHDEFEIIRQIIIETRNARMENKIDLAKKLELIIDISEESSIEDIEKNILSQENLIKKMRTGVENISISKTIIDMPNSIRRTVGKIRLHVPLAGLIDTEKEKERAEKELAGLEKYISGLESRLSDNNFIEKAPKQVITQQKKNLEKAKTEFESIKENLNSLRQ